MTKRVGVLALQGDFREHLKLLAALGADAVPVRRERELDLVVGLVIPGGESTVMYKLSRAFGLRVPLRARIADGMPVYGTCAGLIMLSDRVLDALPDGLATEVGSGGAPLTPAQAQQIALARLVLLDPHTLVLDEATSLLDPRAARHLERSLSAILAGRTVVAIAHRLHTAHDADRVAVVDGGRIVEIGSHDELVAAGGDYAALWHSWQHE